MQLFKKYMYQLAALSIFPLLKHCTAM